MISLNDLSEPKYRYNGNAPFTWDHGLCKLLHGEPFSEAYQCQRRPQDEECFTTQFTPFPSAHIRLNPASFTYSFPMATVDPSTITIGEYSGSYARDVNLFVPQDRSHPLTIVLNLEAPVLGRRPHCSNQPKKELITLSFQVSRDYEVKCPREDNPNLCSLTSPFQDRVDLKVRFNLTYPSHEGRVILYRPQDGLLVRSESKPESEPPLKERSASNSRCCRRGCAGCPIMGIPF